MMKEFFKIYSPIGVVILISLFLCSKMANTDSYLITKVFVFMIIFDVIIFIYVAYLKIKDFLMCIVYEKRRDKLIVEDMMRHAKSGAKTWVGEKNDSVIKFTTIYTPPGYKGGNKNEKDS